MSLAPGWYDDPLLVARYRWWDGSAWTDAIANPPPTFAKREQTPHPTLPLAAAIGAFAAVAIPVFGSKYVLRSLVDREWPIAIYVGLAAVLGYGPALLWCRFASRRWGTGSIRADSGVGWRNVDLGWGVVTYLGCLATQVVVAVIILAARVPVARNTDGIAELRDDRAYVITLLVLAVVAAPIVEEIVFRGFMMRGLLSRMHAVAAIGLQAVLFGVVHIDPARGTGNIGLALVLTAVGVGLGVAAYLLRRLMPTMLAHAMQNGIALAVVLSGALDNLQ
jgi:uncharacterized protein